MSSRGNKMNINDLLEIVIEEKASDLHLTVGIPPTIRLNGKLIHIDLPPLAEVDTKELIEQLLEGKTIIMEKFKEKGEVDFSYTVQDRGRFRVNVYKQRGSWATALRSVSIDIPSMEEIGLPKRILENLADNKRGLILVTGPTGSGKSTTLATMIDYINKNRYEHILTLEDPIEYLHKHKNSMINQREIGFDSKSYASGLRAALREDPDVILVGEMRDQETISTAITAAETGHLVLSTLHTIGAPQTIDRIIDVFPPVHQRQIRAQLANILKGVISQQLLPRSDSKGRCVALEMMITNSAISNLIREEKTHQIYSHLQTGAAIGMVTMETCIARHYKEGKISLETAYQYAQNRDELKRIIEK